MIKLKYDNTYKNFIVFDVDFTSCGGTQAVFIVQCCPFKAIIWFLLHDVVNPELPRTGGPVNIRGYQHAQHLQEKELN